MISDSISAFVSTKIFDTYTMESALNDIIYLQNHAQSWSDIHYVTWGNWMDCDWEWEGMFGKEFGGMPAVCPLTRDQVAC